MIPVTAEPGKIVEAARGLRRGVRDVRDRHVHRRRTWCHVALAGIVASGRAYVMVDGADGNDVVKVFSQRWSGVMLGDALAVPDSSFVVEDAVQLALARRGLQPLRLAVQEQWLRTVVVDGSAALGDGFLEPMPIVF
ncbi:hypothetical protein ACFQU2_39855 [Siccirubricoccus deserti]|uniref:Uncharacterized protein n=1 Tax=Siccirubricoccus deserti TaxID=2013562 RepID=A0A9X0UDZ1_9PROT|nr:hypothetical protein [Siccirubricoccus deserti]MBC4016992.1 hypothetical protein [Siccirubricoccus deserti]